MGTYLHWFNRLKYAGSTLRDRIPFLSKLPAMTTPKEWDLSSFTRSASNAASERHLDSRGRALANRLLVEADREGFPVPLLTEPTENAAKLDWRMRYSHCLIETLDQVEREWSAPTGLRRWLQSGIVFLADWLPLLVLLHMVIGIFLPLRWPAIRAEFQRYLEERLRNELESAYSNLPIEVAGTLLEERRNVEKYIAEVREVSGWLEKREQAASIAGLYGS